MEQETITMPVNEYQTLMELIENQTKQIEILNRKMEIAKEIMDKDEEIIKHQRKIIELDKVFFEKMKKELIDCGKK